MPTENDHEPTFDGDEAMTPGESLEFAVAEIKELLYVAESAWSGIVIAAAEILAEEQGIDPDRTFWATSPLSLSPQGLAWVDEEAEIADLKPPPDPSQGWKLDPKHHNRIRYWWGDKWDPLVLGNPENIFAYKKIAAGIETDPPNPPQIKPVLSP
ncbi:MAG: hypothetical protein J0H66_08735 [Solirubrobacterales bacterium]|nr:hypothetical protein [Solirubrobacterales bacterium]